LNTREAAGRKPVRAEAFCSSFPGTIIYGLPSANIEATGIMIPEHPDRLAVQFRTALHSSSTAELLHERESRRLPG
jgi:hypothetical protein